MRTQKMSSIQTHLLVTYLVAILCPMIAIIIFFTYTISQDISKQRLDFMVQMNAQVNNNVDSLFSGMENIFSMHYLNYSVLDILRERGPLTDLEYIQNNSLMRDVIMQSVGMTQYIENIFVIGRNDVIYTASSATKRQEAFIKSWIDEHFFEDDSGYITDTFSGFDSERERRV